MQHRFFALISRMRYIGRWGLMRNTFEENIQEHSHMVAVLAHGLAVIQRDILGQPADPDRCASAALFHDASEILTGDLPTPIKYYNPEIKKAYKQIEAVSCEKLLALLPPEVQVQEICLRNGTMADCNGCSYTACMHFGEQGGCFYGGPMVEEVYPAVRSCDTLVMVCANYNDALSANLTACVNRLTALFRQTRFYDKRLYGLVVSGYSGGDLLARQLISALNMNKAFYLPPRFCLLETANERGSLVRLPGIREKAQRFARQMME